MAIRVMPTSRQSGRSFAAESKMPDNAMARTLSERPQTFRAAGAPAPAGSAPQSAARPAGALAPRELGGRAGPDPTRFGDWEKHGRCIDF